MTLVGYQVDQAVATITLDSPANRNALSQDLVAELTDRLDDADGDPAVRALVLTHTGSTFCAGNDLREATAAGGPLRGAKRMTALLGKLLAISKPVVARVDGHVRAGGLGVLGASDLVLAGPASTFAFTEARLGLAPAIISLTTLSRMPERASSRYYLTGETFDGGVAERIGLVSEFCPDLDGSLATLLDLLRACSPDGLRHTKSITTARIRAAFESGSDEMLERSAGLFATAAAQEGMQAFLEKRAPSWALPPAT